MSGSTLVLVIVIALLWLGVQALNPPVLTPVSTNSGNTGPTYLGNGLTSTSSLFFTTSANLSLHVLVSSPTAGNTTLSIFESSGSLYAQATLLGQFPVGGLAMKDPLKVFIADSGSAAHQTGSFQVSGGTAALSALVPGNRSVDTALKAAVGLLSTQWVCYVLSDGALGKVGVLDYSVTPIVPMDTVNGTLTVGQPFKLLLYKTDFVVVSMSNTPSIPVIKYSDFSVQYVLNRSTGCSAYASVFDNLKVQNLFEIWDTGSSQLVLASIDVAVTASLTKNFPDLALPDTIYSNILNFGPYQYVAVVTGQGATLPWALTFIYKANLTSVAWPDAQVMVSATGASLIGMKSFDTLHYFSFIDIDGNQDANFHSYYLELDRCNERDGTDPTLCLRCIEPFVRDTVDPGNICLEEPYFPQGQGPDIPGNYLRLCSQSECLNCTSDYTKCSLCDLSLDHYLNFTGDKQCYPLSDITARASPPWGIKVNGVHGTAKACSVGCLDCSQNHDFCVQCDTPIYFHDVTKGVCYTDTSSPSGIGRNTSTHVAVSCTSVNCSSCGPDATICLACKTTVGAYLNTSSASCIHYKNLPAFLGADKTNGQIGSCVDAYCYDCRADRTNCSRCDVANKYFMQGASGPCVAASTLPVGYGGNTASGLVQTCTSSGCTDCKNNAVLCIACDGPAGYFLIPVQSRCIQLSNIPDGFGIDLSSGIIVECSSSGCLDCKIDYRVCHKCDVLVQRMLNTDYCIDSWNSAAFTGLDFSNSKNSPCTVPNCYNCSRDTRSCSYCDETKGYFLEGEVCKLPEWNLSIIENPSKSERTSVSFLVILTYVGASGPKSDIEMFQMLNAVKSSETLNFFFRNPSSQASVDLSWKKLLTVSPGDSQFLIVDISVDEPTELELYDVSVSAALLTKVQLANGTSVYIRGSSGAYTYRSGSTKSALLSAAKSGETASNLINGPGGLSTGTGANILMTVVALDPTGVFMKFNQILKIINKLYFININYGNRLAAFMDSLQTTPPFETRDKTFREAPRSRGKVSARWVYATVEQGVGFRIFLYFALWMTQVLVWIVLLKRKSASFGTWGVKIVSRVRLMIFNAVIGDLCWYGSRALMHNSHLRTGDRVSAWICIILISFDFWTMLRVLFNHNLWVELYISKQPPKITNLTPTQYQAPRILAQGSNFIQFARQAEKVQNRYQARRSIQFVISPMSAAFDTPQATPGTGGIADVHPPKISPFNPNSRADQYRIEPAAKVAPSTIADDYMVRLMSNQLSVTSPSSHTTLACRAQYLIYLVRVMAYPTVILTSQYLSGFGLSCLLLVELSKLSLVVYCYVKYKYLKNIICLLMEVSQSIFLVMFSSIALILHPKRFDEPVIDFYQDAGIWIVIASCVAEYLLLITYITVAAYEFIKNRKVRKLPIKVSNESVTKQEQIPSHDIPMAIEQLHPYQAVTATPKAETPHVLKPRMSISGLPDSSLFSTTRLPLTHAVYDRVKLDTPKMKVIPKVGLAGVAARKRGSLFSQKQNAPLISEAAEHRPYAEATAKSQVSSTSMMKSDLMLPRLSISGSHQHKGSPTGLLQSHFNPEKTTLTSSTPKTFRRLNRAQAALKADLRQINPTENDLMVHDTPTSQVHSRIIPASTTGRLLKKLDSSDSWKSPEAFENEVKI